MLKSARHQKIIDLLGREQSVTTNELIHLLRVTPMTVWRDLKQLEEEKLLLRTRGGAVICDREGEPSFISKQSSNEEAKQRIANWALKNIIKPRLTITCDGGTTVSALVTAIPDAQLTLLTNCIPIAMEARNRCATNSIYCSGGLMRAESATLVGKESVTFFSRQRSDILFMSATGLSSTSGITDPNPMEVEVKQAMAYSAKKVVLLLDSSKFGKESLMEIIPLAKVSLLLTDRAPDKSFTQHIETQGTMLVVVD